MVSAADVVLLLQSLHRRVYDIKHINAHMRMYELVTVFIMKGSCQDNIKVPGVVEARLASSPWQCLTQQSCCAPQRCQVNWRHDPSDLYDSVCLFSSVALLQTSSFLCFCPLAVLFLFSLHNSKVPIYFLTQGPNIISLMVRIYTHS